MAATTGRQRSGLALFSICFCACGSPNTSDNSGGGSDVAIGVDAKTFDIKDNGPDNGDASDTAISDEVSAIDAEDAGSDTTGPLDTGPKFGCGDGICSSPETLVTCPADCKKPVCGDGFCQKPESGVGCPLDCAPATLAELACIKKLCPAAVSACSQDVTCAGVLGSALDCASSAGGDAGIIDNCAQGLTLNGKSSPLTATACGFIGCAGQPPGAICGDGVCQSSESSAGCAYDCVGVAGKCGDGTCSGSETSASCPADCATSSVCGNGQCETGETSGNCLSDCPVVAVCGDGACDAKENTSTCALDCDPALKAKTDCLKALCGGEFDACAADQACISAITAGLKCAAKCASGDIVCFINCYDALSGNTTASPLATCAQSKCP
jgi:hypothetical protein